MRGSAVLVMIKRTTMKVLERVNAVDVTVLVIPPIVLRALLAWFLSGVLVSLLAPVLRVAGVEPRQWMAWAVTLLVFALCLGPALLRRRNGA